MRPVSGPGSSTPANSSGGRARQAPGPPGPRGRRGAAGRAARGRPAGAAARLRPRAGWKARPAPRGPGRPRPPWAPRPPGRGSGWAGRCRRRRRGGCRSTPPGSGPAHGGVGQARLLLQAEAGVGPGLAGQGGGEVAHPQQGLARPQVGEHALDGVGDEDEVELHSLGLVQGGQGQAVLVGRGVLEQGGGLEVLGLAPAQVVGQGGAGVALVEALQHLGQGGPGGAVGGSPRRGGHLGGVGQGGPQVPEALDGRPARGPGGIGDQAGQGLPAGQAAADDLGPGVAGAGLLALEVAPGPTG